MLLTKGVKSIFAYCKKEDTITKLIWRLKDFAVDDATSKNEIAFIKNLTNITDIDGDGYVEPILVYSFEKNHSYDEGSVKIIIRYRNKKIAIRHKNAILETERKTQIDEDFHNLPPSVKTKVKQIMLELTENNYAVFSAEVLENIDS